MANSPNDVLETLTWERQRYGTPMSNDACVNMLNTVAWVHRNADETPCWVANHKSWGAGVGTRYDGEPLSADTLIDLRSRHIYDVLESSPVVARPIMHDLGLHGQMDDEGRKDPTQRYPVPPIPHKEWNTPISNVQTELGATMFCLFDYYLHDRPRGERIMAHLREDLGATFLRPFWRKGTGLPGDYWRNDGGPFGCVQENPDPLAMREAMLWAHQNGFLLGHTIFADSLSPRGGHLSIDEQKRRVDAFIQAVSPIQFVSRYYVIFNEPYTQGGGHGGRISDLHACCTHLRRALGPEPLIALGTPHSVHAGPGAVGMSIEDEVRAMHGNFPDSNMITMHVGRRRPNGEPNTNPTIFPDLGPIAPAERSSDEPIGPDSSVAETKDAAGLAADFTATQQNGCRFYVYHDHWLIRPRGSNIWDRPEWPAIAASLKTASGGNGGGDTSPYGTASPYIIQGGSMEIGGLVGAAGKFARIDPGEYGQGMWPESFPVHFDRDHMEGHEQFQLEPLTGGKFKLVHQVTGHLLGADATQYSGDACKQFYTLPPERLGPYETWTVVTTPSGAVIAYVEFAANNQRFVSASLTWVRA